MSVQFATDSVPAYRRLALWQDIVCDVYVQLDCQSDLGHCLQWTGHAGAAGRGKLHRSVLTAATRLSYPLAHRPIP
jgi:hypothetical protein